MQKLTFFNFITCRRTGEQNERGNTALEVVQSWISDYPFSNLALQPSNGKSQLQMRGVYTSSLLKGKRTKKGASTFRTQIILFQPPEN